MHKQQGYIALTSLLIIAAIAGVIALSATLLSVREITTSMDAQQDQEILAIAESCIEESLLRLRDSASYTGSTIPIGRGSCTIVISGIGNSRTVTVTATMTALTQHTKNVTADVVAVAGHSVSLVSIQEVP